MPAYKAFIHSLLQTYFFIDDLLEKYLLLYSVTCVKTNSLVVKFAIMIEWIIIITITHNFCKISRDFYYTTE